MSVLAVVLRLFFIGFVLSSLIKAQATETASGSDTAEKGLETIEKGLGGRLGVAALDTGGDDRRLEHRANERFPMCSTFKVLAVAAVLHRVDKKQDQLSRFVPYTSADLLKYAPVTTKHVKEGAMALGALCAAALELSDNTAANLLLKTIGGPEGLTRYARALGDQKTRLDRIEPDLNSAIPGDERDTTTPAAMLADLRMVLLGDALSPASRTQLEAWLKENKTGAEMLRAGVPKDWRVGDKTGRGAYDATNDIAILRPPGKKPILVAVYSVDATVSSTARNSAIAQVARLIVQAFK